MSANHHSSRDDPVAVAAHLAAQLGIADPGVLKQYAAREGRNRLHPGEIQHVSGYRDFADPAVQQELIGWLEARTRLSSERPSVLFDLVTARLLDGSGGRTSARNSTKNPGLDLWGDRV